jgi:hypothetical protein
MSRSRVNAVDTSVTWPDDAPAIAGHRDFQVLGDHDGYIFSVLDGALTFRFDWPHRERGDLHGQLTVTTTLHSARTFNRVLNIGSCNLSSSSARSARAKLLMELARQPQIDFPRLLEEFAIRVLDADTLGAPAVTLGELPDDGADDHFDLDGVTVTRGSGSLLFADAGTMKSYWALYQLGRLAERGVRVGFVDFELDGLPHQRRWQALWPVHPPMIRYVHCNRSSANSTACDASSTRTNCSISSLTVQPRRSATNRVAPKRSRPSVAPSGGSGVAICYSRTCRKRRPTPAMNGPSAVNSSSRSVARFGMPRRSRRTSTAASLSGFIIARRTSVRCARPSDSHLTSRRTARGLRGAMCATWNV